MRYFIVTGEPSGDALGAKLLSALRDRDPQAEFLGVGGDAMAREGFRSLFPLSDISVMGILPVLARLPTLLRRIAETARAAAAARPDVLVLIDSPDFTHRVAKKARKTLPGLKVVDYVSPTVWAWRPGRAKKMRKSIDLVLALLPFEPAAHQKLGGPECLYVGHPLIERLADLRGEEGSRKNGPVLVLPGSRRSVLARMGPVFRDTLVRLKTLRPELEVVLPVAGPIETLVRETVETWPIKPRIVSGEAGKYAAFRTARAALAASGTVTLELALSGTPTVVAYKVPKLEEIIGRRLIQVPTIVLPNLILGENAFPEFLQDDANPETLARELAAVLDAGAARDQQVAALAKISEKMLLPCGQTPSAAAAAAILALVHPGRAVNG
jgi:lipid-A-disaccharide synthase